MKFSILIFVSALILLSCGTQEVNSTKTNSPKSNDFTSSIQPVQGIDDSKVVYKIDAQSPEIIELKRGGSLIFDQDAFIDSDGNLIKGEVEIQWEEFHSLADIMLSGIPMKYDSSGVANNLESGGMFTFSGSQNGTPIDIAPNKKAEVNLASIQDTPCYNFYELDEKSGDWSYETTATGVLIDEGSEDTPINEVENEKSQNLIDVTLDTRKFPELKELDIIAWKAKKDLSSFDKAMLKSQLTKVRLLQTDSLGLTLEAIDHNKKSRLYAVEPYLMDEAMADTEVNRSKMESEIVEMAEYMTDVAAGKIIRSISVSNFGTYNWDCIHQFEDPQRVIASFDFPSNVNPELVSVYLLAPDRNIVIRCNSKGDSNFFFDPNQRNCLIAILPNNRIISVSNNGFNAVREKRNGNSHSFVFKETSIKLKSSADIMNHMNTLI